MDGGDDVEHIWSIVTMIIYGFDMLRAADVAGLLNSQVHDMQRNFQP